MAGLKIHKILVLSLLLFLVGCETVKLGTLEKLGYEKRDILTGRIEKAKDAQQDAKEQFKSALQEFQSVVKFDGGDLEALYERLNDEYEQSQQSAEEVSERIASVEYVAEKLFDEWKEELGQYSSADLRRKSEGQLSKTQRQYKKLMGAMKKAEKSIAPVLALFKDHVLFLKHNLNAQAIASMKNELKVVQNDVSRLISQMNQSINEADKFIAQMKKP
ncbi:DUF2959 domain-containing protein [Aliikangiella coralliicola]|uniref:DUF2959 domain-containing protein n=1 Tax=Aliikangiella coralliicola TaxID=2592383 RepID=A0A545UGD3_9GAMM|nr:DUF2959 domain-containing protein [Aliikangiella coralliicola]TQV88463.1 DUF2959 domain-containing protein [Aliikangiella coralliicola]